MSAAPAVPEPLRRFVVDQHPDRYRPVDHEVWRRVTTALGESLRHVAHASYARGFTAAGMDRERIPRIASMSESLSEHGWSAVAVDGFIPPRAFQAFQAARILPIARDVRRIEHVEYTPAPDILHEAAGHAPMLADPEYAEFARRIGELGRRTFRLPHDDEAFEAIRELSIVKESSDATPDELARVDARVARAMDPSLPVSEAARLARLYWWTIEYGLVGAIDDFRLYGAGLLSSPGESTSCLASGVRKLRLTASCVDVPYDITKPQPQLFVVRSFTELARVLDDVMATTAYRRGGLDSLAIAAASDERALVRFGEGGSLEARFGECTAIADRTFRVSVVDSLVLRDRIGRVLGVHVPAESGGELAVVVDPLRAKLIRAGTTEVVEDTRGGIVSCQPAVG